MQKVEDVRKHFIQELAAERFATDKTGCKTIEMLGASFLANESAIFGTPNMDYIAREVEWYDSMSLSVKDFPGGAPTQWQKTANEDGLINSNYGWVAYHKDNYFQYDNALNELRKNPDSRRAVIIYTRPSMWWDFDANGKSDFMCTNVVQYFIRDGKLHVVVQMRSNDVVFGYKNDYAWQLVMQVRMAADLNVGLGDIIWQVGNLHVYDRHFHLVKEG